MSFFIDLVVIGIIIANVVIYAKRGLVGTTIDIAGFVFSVIVAWSFAPEIGSYILGFMKKLVPENKGGIIVEILTSAALSRIVAFVGVFLALMLVVKAIVKLAQSIKIPIISTFDKLLGGALGLVLGLAWAQIASMMIFALLEILANNVNSFPVESFSGMVVTKWFFDFNVFKTVFSVI